VAEVACHCRLWLGFDSPLRFPCVPLAQIDAALRTAEQAKLTNIQGASDSGEQAEYSRSRIKLLNEELEILLRRAYLLRRLLFLLHVSLLCLFLSAFWSAVCIYRERFVYGNIVLMCVAMGALAVSLFFAFVELHLSVQVEHMETEVVNRIPTKVGSDTQLQPHSMHPEGPSHSQTHIGKA